MNSSRTQGAGFMAAVFAGALILVASSCSDETRPLEIRIALDDAKESIAPERLLAKIYTTVERSEVLATAIQPDGQPVSAVDCEVLAAFAPTATSCVETEELVKRDDVLVHAGPIGNNGSLTIDRPITELRIYVDQAADGAQADGDGRVCGWIGGALVAPDADAIVVPVTAAC